MRATEERSETAPSAAQPAAKAPFFPDPELVAVALESGKIGIWCWHLADNRLTWSTNLLDIHELPQDGFDGSFSSFQNDIHPEDRAGVMAAIQETLRTHRPHRTLYRLPPRTEGAEEWIEALGTVVLEGGTPVRMVGTCRNVTERVKVHRELRARASQQEAVARLGERALTEEDLQKFFDDAVGTIAKILNADAVNILELIPGDAELVLRSGVGWNEGLIGTAHVSTGRDTQAGYTLATRAPVIVENLAEETRFTPAPILQAHTIASSVTTPIAGRDGRAYGVLGAHVIVRRRFSESEVAFLALVANVIAAAIQRLETDQRQQLMIKELRHRSGNLFAQLLALFSQTAKSSKNLPDLVTKYQARVLALANAHRLITEGGWKSASLTQMLDTLLAAHVDRMTFAGPSVYLDPHAAFGLGMVLHELVTNASRFGSLSTRAGRVEVTWKVDHTSQGLTLVLDWKEFGGPAPKRVRRAGFGSKLITNVIERQLNGTVGQTFGPQGVAATLVVPLTHERWPGAPVPEPLMEGLD